MKSKSVIGVVVIGRNEGKRLEICLKSILSYTSKIIYVDSASTDGSRELAHSLGIHVHNLDVTIPFTAARARNEGFYTLLMYHSEIRYVQFVDGDCEMDSGWLDKAENYLNENKKVAITCGRRRERYPESTIYNTLCDIEWDTPIGNIKSCGGDSMIRVDAFKEVSGFNENFIAGEEPELCVRIRKNGWKIQRLNYEMTLHDANITRFSQWWRRNVRAGYAYALGAELHGQPPERHNIVQVRRCKLWAIYIPVLIVIASLFNINFTLLFVIYPLQVIRIAILNKNNITSNWIYAFYITASKFPEAQGLIKYYIDKLCNRKSKIIEYK